MLNEKADIPVAKQKLVFLGKELSDQVTFSGCGVKPESIVHLFLQE